MTHDRYGRLSPMISMTWPTKMHEFVAGVPMTYQRPYLNVVVEPLLHRHGGQFPDRSEWPPAPWLVRTYGPTSKRGHAGEPSGRILMGYRWKRRQAVKRPARRDRLPFPPASAIGPGVGIGPTRRFGQEWAHRRVLSAHEHRPGWCAHHSSLQPLRQARSP
jgi:hypothetical protein